MKPRTLTRSSEVARPLAETFEFFADPRNLPLLTPPGLRFRFTREPPSQLFLGAELEYRIRLYGVPVRWVTRIEQYAPPHHFVDIQASGPYAHWRHTHAFEAIGKSRTLVRDEIEFALPFGPFGAIAYAFFVRRALAQIFDYRENRFRELLGA
jgi:hypothetical protein